MNVVQIVNYLNILMLYMIMMHITILKNILIMKDKYVTILAVTNGVTGACIAEALKNKTRLKIRADTEMKKFPLFCPKCKQETLISVKQLKISILKEPDA